MFFFFILVIVIMLFIIGLAIHTSRIGIEVENLIINTEMPKGEKVNEQSKIYVYILIFGKIKLFKRDVRNMPNFKLRNKVMDIKILKNKDFNINYKELLQNVDIDMKKIDLYVQISTQNAALTAILVGIISSILGVILRKPKYQITPIYSNKNSLKIKLDGIFSVYLMQYIYMRKKGQKIPGHKCPKM